MAAIWSMIGLPDGLPVETFPYQAARAIEVTGRGARYVCNALGALGVGTSMSFGVAEVMQAPPNWQLLAVAGKNIAAAAISTVLFAGGQEFHSLQYLAAARVADLREGS